MVGQGDIVLVKCPFSDINNSSPQIERRYHRLIDNIKGIPEKGFIIP